MKDMRSMLVRPAFPARYVYAYREEGSGSPLSILSHYSSSLSFTGAGFVS